MAINSMFYKNRPACVQCGLCGGFGCEVMAKSSSVWTVIPEAEETGNCEVRANSYVFRVGVNDAGRAIFLMRRPKPNFVRLRVREVTATA